MNPSLDKLRALAPKNISVPMPLVFTAASVIAWLVLSGVLLSSGLLWWAAKPSLENSRPYALQRQLFDADASEFSNVFIGDRLFIRRAKQAYAAEADTSLFLEIPKFFPDDLRSILSGLRSLKVDRLVIQSSPHFWTDFWSRIPGLTTQHWNAHGQLPSVSFKSAGIVLDTLHKMASASRSERRRFRDRRPRSMVALRYQKIPPRAKSGLGALKKATPRGFQSVVWVRDTQQTAADLPAPVMAQFEKRFGSQRFEKGFGHILPGFQPLP